MNGNAYKNLLVVVKLVLVLSHDQVAVERGFSVNKEAEVENLKGHTLIAMRTVIDHVNNVDGIFNVEMSKPLLLSVKQSRQRYGLYLEKEREKNKSEESQAKKKAALQDIEELKQKKAKVESDIANLHDSVDGLLHKGETEKSQAHKYLVQANSLCSTAKRKAEEVADIEKELEQKLSRLKD